MSNEKVDPVGQLPSGIIRSSLYVLREVAHLTRDVGMPIAVFSAGIVLLLFIGTETLADRIVAVGLVLLGLLSQMWIYARENPVKRSDQIITHLREITEMAKALSSPSDHA